MSERKPVLGWEQPGFDECHTHARLGRWSLEVESGSDDPEDGGFAVRFMGDTEGPWAGTHKATQLAAEDALAEIGIALVRVLRPGDLLASETQKQSRRTFDEARAFFAALENNVPPMPTAAELLERRPEARTCDPDPDRPGIPYEHDSTGETP